MQSESGPHGRSDWGSHSQGVILDVFSSTIRTFPTGLFAFMCAYLGGFYAINSTYQTNNQPQLPRVDKLRILKNAIPSQVLLLRLGQLWRFSIFHTLLQPPESPSRTINQPHFCHSFSCPNPKIIFFFKVEIINRIFSHLNDSFSSDKNLLKNNFNVFLTPSWYKNARPRLTQL